MTGERNVLLRAFLSENYFTLPPTLEPRATRQDRVMARHAGLIAGGLTMPLRLTKKGRERLGEMTEERALEEFRTAVPRSRTVVEQLIVDAQIRALGFVRYLDPATIERVIADIDSGKVKL